MQNHAGCCISPTTNFCNFGRGPTLPFTCGNHFLGLYRCGEILVTLVFGSYALIVTHPLVQISFLKLWPPTGTQSWAPTSWEVSRGPVPHVGMGPMASFEMSAANTILLVQIPKQWREEIVTNTICPKATYVSSNKVLPNLLWEFKLPNQSSPSPAILGWT